MPNALPITVSTLGARRSFFAALIARGYDIDDAVELAHVERSVGKQWLKDRRFKDLIGLYTDKPSLALMDLIGEGMLRAVGVLTEVMESSDEKNRLKAAKTVLDAGLTFQLKVADLMRRDRSAQKEEVTEEKLAELGETLKRLVERFERSGRRAQVRAERLSRRS